MNAASFMDYDPAIKGYRFLRLTADDPVVESTTSGPTDEGHASTWRRWEYDPDAGIVTCTTNHDERDCDGRMFTSSTVSCALADLAAGTPYTPDDEEPRPFGVPAWQEVSASQRDYQAEAAGY